MDQDFLRSPGQLGPSGHCACLRLLSSGPPPWLLTQPLAALPPPGHLPLHRGPVLSQPVHPPSLPPSGPSLRPLLPCTAPHCVAAYLCPEHLRGTALTEFWLFSPTGPSPSFPSSHLHGHALHLSFMQCQDPPEIPDANLPVSNSHSLWYSHRMNPALRRALPLGFHALSHHTVLSS